MEYDYCPMDTPAFANSLQYSRLHKNGWLFGFCFELIVVSFLSFLDTCSFLYLRVRFYPFNIATISSQMYADEWNAMVTNTNLTLL